MANDPRAALLRFLLEHQRDAVLVWNPDGSIAEQNRSARQLGPEVTAALARLSREVDAASSSPVRITTAEGKVLVAEATAVESFVVVVVREASAQARLDEEMHRLHSRAALGLVTASLMHDMNNLLTPILLTSSRLASELTEGRNHKMAQLLYTSANLAASLTRNVLAIARPRAPLVERVNVTDAVREIAPLVERLLRDDVELILDLTDDAGTAMLDRKRFQHALLNLVANARDAMPEGGLVTITSRVVYEAGRRRIALSVEDTGVGMSSHVRQRAFQGFFTTKGPSGGLGLGLASVHRFVTESGGEIDLKSELSKGTTVTMVFDGSSASETRETTTSMPAATGDGEVILVAAHDDGVRHAVRLALEADGYVAFTAESEARALEQVSAHSVDVAILDDRMVLSNPRWIHRLRRARPNLRLVFMSDGTGGDNVQDLVCTVLSKAFSKEDLRRAVRHVLDSPPSIGQTG